MQDKATSAAQKRRSVHSDEADDVDGYSQTGGLFFMTGLQDAEDIIELKRYEKNVVNAVDLKNNELLTNVYPQLKMVGPTVNNRVRPTCNNSLFFEYVVSMWLEKLSLIHNESDENYEYSLTLHFGSLCCKTNFSEELLAQPLNFKKLHKYFNNNEPRDYLYNKDKHSTDNQETILKSVVGACQGKCADGKEGDNSNLQQESQQRQPYIIAPIFHFGGNNIKALARCKSKNRTVAETVQLKSFTVPGNRGKNKINVIYDQNLIPLYHIKTPINDIVLDVKTNSNLTDDQQQCLDFSIRLERKEKEADGINVNTAKTLQMTQAYVTTNNNDLVPDLKFDEATSCHGFLHKRIVVTKSDANLLQPAKGTMIRTRQRITQAMKLDETDYLRLYNPKLVTDHYTTQTVYNNNDGSFNRLIKPQTKIKIELKGLPPFGENDEWQELITSLYKLGEKLAVC